VTENWRSSFHQGVRHLSRHDAAGALPWLSRALQGCPARPTEDLTRVLYYLGIALNRLGYSNSAVRSWTASLRMKRSKHTRQMLGRFANSYGMAKQGCRELDDWQAFHSIHLLRYLRGFKRRSLSSAAERRMLSEIIHSYWDKLRDSGALDGKSCAEKMDIFKSVRIDFPLFCLDDGRDCVLQVDFWLGRKVRTGDVCPCGSGLPFLACCGRTPGEDELAVGLF
jgi:hypothetical protein